MGATTAISWTTHSWNPWQGCEAVSDGCTNCYAKTQAERWGRDFADVHRSAPATFRAPLSKKWSEPAFVFTCSISDFFHNDADAWRPEAWEIIKATPWLTYQILTKRHGRIASHLPPDWGEGYPNVWLGVSAENQEWADRRIPVLLKVPARKRFVSAEPLLGPIDLGLNTATCDCCPRWSSRWVRLPRTVRADPYPFLDGRPLPTAAPKVYRAESNRHGALSVRASNGSLLGIRPAEFEALPPLDWVIVGGESGPGFRPMPHHWAREIRDQCVIAGVPFFFKQSSGIHSETGKQLDGVRWEQMPTTVVR